MTAPASSNPGPDHGSAVLIIYGLPWRSCLFLHFPLFQAASLHYARSDSAEHTGRQWGRWLWSSSSAAAAWVGPIRHGATARRAAAMHFIQEFTIQYPEFTENFHKFTIFFMTFFTIFFRHDFQYGIFHWKMAKIHDIWHEFMKNHDFWCTRKCRLVSWQKFYIRVHIQTHGKSRIHIWTHEKTYDFGCTKTCPVIVVIPMNSYMKANFMSSYENSYMKLY